MSNFSTLSLAQLDLVSGGEGEIFGPGAGEVRTNIEGNGSFQTPVGMKLEGGGKYQSTTDKGTACLDLLKQGGIVDKTNAAALVRECYQTQGK